LTEGLGGEVGYKEGKKKPEIGWGLWKGKIGKGGWFSEGGLEAGCREKSTGEK